MLNSHPVAACDYFNQNIVTKMAARLVNARLIKRKRDSNDEKSPLAIMEEILNEGKSVIIFPEGTRGEPGKMQELKVGAALLLKKFPHIPFVPAYAEDLGRCLPRGTSLLVPHNSYIRLGK
jgi:1-acyl-sn-glycerol-3-phosphate acyltransferase